MRSTLLLSAVLLAAFAATARAGTGPVEQTAFSTDTGTAAQTTFKPDTAKIEYHVQIQNVAVGDKFTATWIAVDCAGAPPNYQIASSNVSIDDVKESELDFSLTKPDAGWPVGKYAVALTYNDKPAVTDAFTVAK